MTDYAIIQGLMTDLETEMQLAMEQLNDCVAIRRVKHLMEGCVDSFTDLLDYLEGYQ